MDSLKTNTPIGLWCLMPLSTQFRLFRGENQRPVLKWRYVLIAQVVVNPTAIPSRPPLK